VNTEYRIEEYIESRGLEFSEISQKKLYRKLACKIAQFHSLDIENIDKTPFIDKMEARIEKWKRLEDQCSEEIFSVEELVFIKEVQCLSDKEEIEFLKSLVPTKNLVLSHNDIHTQNVLLTRDNDPILIDYEEGCYNFRGFDIGNMFCEGMLHLSYEKLPAYQFDEKLYPSEEELKDFLRYYVMFSKLKNITSEEMLVILDNEEVLREYEMKMFEEGEREGLIGELLEEIKIGSLVSCYYWTIWAVSKEKGSQFDFLQIGKDRFQCYQKWKQSILANHNFRIQNGKSN